MNNKENKELMEDIREFIFTRQERGEFLYEKYRKYKKLSEKSTDIFNKITNILKDDDKKLIREYENITSQQLEIQCEEEYKKGFKDCANILKIIFIR